jgi:hypothetical protein
MKQAVPTPQTSMYGQNPYAVKTALIPERKSQTTPARALRHTK